MAIDFNKQLVFDPKIEIVGEEVPLAAMEKTGAVLQDRYDKAYEQYSLADEALKQMEASANPVDRDKAKELRGLYNQEMQGILQKGDFHNMRHQVSALARNAAANYKTIAERNQIIQQQLDAISKDPRYRLDPEGAVQDYLKNLKSIEINPETRTVSNFNVGTYGEAADVDKMKWAVTYGALMKPIVDKQKGTSIVSVDAYGNEVSDPKQAVMLMTKTKSGQLIRLTPEQISQALSPAAIADPNIQAELNRNVRRAGYDINTEEGKLYKQKLFNEQVLPTIGAAAGLLRQQQDIGAETIGFHNIPSRNVGSGSGSEFNYQDWFVPSVQTKGSEPTKVANPLLNTNVPQQVIQKGIIEGNNDYYNELIEALDYNLENTKGSQKQRFVEAKKMFTDYKKLVEDFPEYTRTLSEIASREPGSLLKNISDKFLAGVENIGSLFSDPKRQKEFSTRLFQLDEKYRNYIGQGFSDSDIEQGIENYFKLPVKPVSTSTPMIAPGMMNKEGQAALKALSDFVNPEDVRVYKKQEGFDPQQKYEFQKVSSEPFGNGTGIVFEVSQKTKDGKTVTALVEPNYTGNSDLYSQFEMATGIPLKMANQFKNTTPFKKVGSKKSLQSLVEENELFNTPIGNLFTTTDLKDLNINKVNNGYTIDRVVDSNGNPKVFSSYIEGIAYILKKLQ